MESLDRNNAVPLYHQLADRIYDDYIRQNINSGAPIPAERELCEQYRVSRITVRGAVNLLVKRGMVQKIQGKGTFITGLNPSIRINYHGVRGFSRSCLQRGVTVHSRVLSIDIADAPEDEQAFFSIPPTEALTRIVRLRYFDNAPGMIETIYLPKTYLYLRGENFEDSFYQALNDKYGIYPKVIASWLELCRADAHQAELLGVDEHSTLISMHHNCCTQDDKPLHTSLYLMIPSVRYYF